MATTITSGNATNGGAAISADNTGILELKTGTGSGTTAMTLNASQNVGIGTTSPAYALEVKRAGVISQIAATSDTTAAYSYARYNSGATDVVTGVISDPTTGYISVETNHPLVMRTNATEQARITTTGLFQFNSGFGSVATAYGCRAWVNWNGTANTNLSGTYSQSGTTVTVTATAHGLIAGNVVYSDITTGTAVDGTYTVATVPTADTFTYTAGTSLTTSGNITLRRNTIRASGNVSSVADNGTGDYTVNFATAISDTNYCAVTGSNISTSIDPAAGAVLPILPATWTTRTTTALRITNQYSSSAAAFDIATMQVAIFR
jgi:hypothetical protein